MLERLREIYITSIKDREKTVTSLILLIGDVMAFWTHLEQVLAEEGKCTDKELTYLISELGRMYKEDYSKEKL